MGLQENVREAFIRISAEVEKQGLYICVMDNGKGITGERLEELQKESGADVCAGVNI